MIAGRPNFSVTHNNFTLVTTAMNTSIFNSVFARDQWGTLYNEVWKHQISEYDSCNSPFPVIKCMHQQQASRKLNSDRFVWLCSPWQLVYISRVPVELRANLFLNKNHLAITALAALHAMDSQILHVISGALMWMGEFSLKPAQHSASSTARLLHLWPNIYNFLAAIH